jgi:dihydrodipicolinate synthase/N-acetylneuraminate lyase
MVGVISLSLGTIIERIERSRSLGFREFQISLPSWGALTDRELDRFFAETCGRFPDCSFLHYNVARAKRMLGPAEYRRLAEAHPNLVAVKATGVDAAQVRDFLATVPRLKFYFTEFGYAEGRRIGSCGLLISMASMHHGRAREFVGGDDGLRAGFLEDFRAIGANLRDTISKGRLHMDGAYDQMIFRVNNPWFPTRLLPPYEGPSEEDFRRFRDSLPARWKSGEIR